MPFIFWHLQSFEKNCSNVKANRLFQFFNFQKTLDAKNLLKKKFFFDIKKKFGVQKKSDVKTFFDVQICFDVQNIFDAKNVFDVKTFFDVKNFFDVKIFFDVKKFFGGKQEVAPVSLLSDGFRCGGCCCYRWVIPVSAKTKPHA